MATAWIIVRNPDTCACGAKVEVDSQAEYDFTAKSFIKCEKCGADALKIGARCATAERRMERENLAGQAEPEVVFAPPDRTVAKVISAANELAADVVAKRVATCHGQAPKTESPLKTLIGAVDAFLSHNGGGTIDRAKSDRIIALIVRAAVE